MSESTQMDSETQATEAESLARSSARSSAENAADNTAPEIKIDVWFDVRCPWCFLGKRRLERGVELFHEVHPSVPVTVEHHSFELAPGIPERFAGGEAEYLLEYEGVPLEQSREMLPQIQRVAESEGITLRFDDLQEVNTRRAHRVFQYGQKRGVGEALLERLFTAYFTECRDMADPETLVALAAELGLDSIEDRAAVRAAAEPGEWDAAVSADHVRGEMLGASSVPFALFNTKYKVPGAQSAEVLAEAMGKLMQLEYGDR